MRLLLTEGQQSDHKGAATLLPDLPPAQEMQGDKGYDSNAYRAALIERGITPCTPQHTVKAYTNSDIESKTCLPTLSVIAGTHLPGNDIKDWRRIAMRFERCAHAFLSVIQIAAIIIFWINQ